MSGVNYMEKLFQGINVEWKPLGEILVRTKGTNITAGQMKELHKDGASLKIFAGGKTIAFVDFKDIPKKDINTEPSIIVKSRGFIEFDYYDKPFSHKNEMWSYHSKNKNINIKFVYYFLKINEPYFQNLGSRMQMPQISIPDTDKFCIPIPPLNVQSEIVRILDNFTELTAELTAELHARKKQYTHYRDKLLTFEERQVEWKTLGEVGEFVRGNGLQKSDFRESGVGCIHYGQIYTYYNTFAYKTKSFVSLVLANKLRKAQKGDLIIATTSENIEDVCKPLVWLGEDEVCVSGETYIFKHNQNPKYLAYYLQTPMFFDFKKRNRTGTKVIRVHGDKLAEFQIPLPSLEEQERIVSILDKFDALTTSMTEGLPREIELRQKQYEYYRNLLLTFPKAEA